MITEQEKEHFLSKVIVRGIDECWDWKLAKDSHGYGVIGYREKQFRANRVMWYIVNGDIPKGYFVCHKCDNPPCVNPNHLFLGTPLDNMRDMIEKGRARKFGRPKGFTNPGAGKNFPEKQFGEYNKASKLTWEIVDNIREEYFSKRNMRGIRTHLSRKYNISIGWVSSILAFLSWNKREVDGVIVHLSESSYLED